MTDISIIVPIYNPGTKLEKCLDSVLNQTDNENIELILINDGSTDDSQNIVEKFIEKNNSKIEIKYFSKENEGISKTRNFGIEKSNSKYIMFLDSDDYLDENTIRILRENLKNAEDIIKFKLQRVDDKGEIKEKVGGPVFENLSGEKSFDLLYCNDVLLDSPCVYLMKKEIFTKNNYKFERKYHEDFGLIPFIILVAKNVKSIDKYLYNYVQSEESITRTENQKKIIQKMEDVLYHYDNMIKRLENMNMDIKTKENVKIYYTNSIILKLDELNEKNVTKYIKEIKKRKMYKNIKVRNIKQLFKRIILMFNIKLYLKIR